jgi:hypothetical protein
MPDPHVPVIEEGAVTAGEREIPKDERKAGTIPPGTYDAELREVAIVKRQKDGSHVLRLLCRTTDLGRYVIAWHGLSENPADPFDLTDGQRRGLRRVADRLGVESTGEPVQVVERIAGLLTQSVQVRVSRTPVGQQVTVTRERPPVGRDAPAGGVVLSVERGAPGCTCGTPPFAPPEPSDDCPFHAERGVVLEPDSCPDGLECQTCPAAGEDDVCLPAERPVTGNPVTIAHGAHAKVIEGLRGVRLSLALVAEGCHELHVTEGWRELGYESLSEYLAAPEITISRTEFYRMAEIWSAYVLNGGVEPIELQGAGPSKLEVPLPAITAGVVSAVQAVADATSMTRKDLRSHYAGLVGDEEPKPKPKRPVEITDEMVERGALAIWHAEPDIDRCREYAKTVLLAALNPNEETT